MRQGAWWRLWTNLLISEILYIFLPKLMLSLSMARGLGSNQDFLCFGLIRILYTSFRNSFFFLPLRTIEADIHDANHCTKTALSMPIMSMGWKCADWPWSLRIFSNDVICSCNFDQAPTRASVTINNPLLVRSPKTFPNGGTISTFQPALWFRNVRGQTDNFLFM